MPMVNSATIVFSLLLELFPGPQYASVQDQGDRQKIVEGTHGPPSERAPDGSRNDLWYGTPEAALGGDLIPAILDLVRHPSRILDFTPRRVRSIAPTAEDPDVWRTSSE